MAEEPLPQTGQLPWEAAQQTPWFQVNNALRTHDAFCVRIVVLSRESDPPAECADGARFLIDGSATGDWDGQDGGIAIAVGDDASNGWIVVPAENIEQEGNEIYIVAERRTIQRQEASWVEGNYVFIDMAYAVDGGVVRWDQSNGQFYVAAE